MLSASILLPSFCTCSLSSPFRSLCMTHSLIPSLFLCALGTSVAIRLVLIVWAIFIRQPSWCISSKYVELDYNFLSQSNIFAVKMRDICWKCGTYTENPEHMLRMRDICWKVKMRDICWKWGTYAENAGHMLKILTMIIIPSSVPFSTISFPRCAHISAFMSPPLSFYFAIRIFFHLLFFSVVLNLSIRTPHREISQWNVVRHL